MKLKAGEAVIGSSQILNHPTMVKQPQCARSDCQQVMFSRNSGITHAYHTCELSRHGQKSATDHFKSSITHINFIKISLFQLQYNFNLTDITIHKYNSPQMTPSNQDFIKSA